MKTTFLTLVFFVICGLMQGQIADSSSLKVANDTSISFDKMPLFPGGEPALAKYLRDSMNYPKEALDSGINGTVFVQFVIAADGSISDVKVMKGIGWGCDEEAIRLVEGMPDWSPAIINGIPSKCHFNLPVRFQIYSLPSNSEQKKRGKNKK